MTKEKLEEYTKIKDDIEFKKNQLRKIHALYKSCGVHGKIVGTSVYDVKVEHFFSDKSIILKILNEDRDRIEKELIELEKNFLEKE